MCVSFKFWILAICLCGILIKNLTWRYLFSFFLVIILALSFLTCFRCALTGDWSSFTGNKDNPLTGNLRCSFTEDMFFLIGDVGRFTGDVKVLYLWWDWWELYLPFLMFVVRKCPFLSRKWLYSSSDEDSFEDIWES